MSRPPQINIVANGDGAFTTAHIGKKLVVVRWRWADLWWVASPSAGPMSFGAESDAMRAFMDIAMEAR